MGRYAHPEALVAAEWLDEHLGEAWLRIVDVRYSLTGRRCDPLRSRVLVTNGTG